MKYDLHIHSKYSYDSSLNPEKIIRYSKKKGLNGIAITDHGTIKGGIETSKLSKNDEFKIIVGAEIKTEYGDVIGLFLNEEIRSTKFDEVLDEIKMQGGLSILAHPYRQYKFPEKIITGVDMIEGFNARSKTAHNKKAYELGINFNKSMTAGSDAHSYFEIGRGITEVENVDDLLRQKTNVYGKETNYYLSHGLSVINEQFRKLVHQ